MENSSRLQHTPSFSTNLMMTRATLFGGTLFILAKTIVESTSHQAPIHYPFWAIGILTLEMGIWLWTTFTMKRSGSNNSQWAVHLASFSLILSTAYINYLWIMGNDLY